MRPGLFTRMAVTAVAVACLPLVGRGATVQVKVTITNLAPTNGVALSPFFLGAHDGSFNAFTPGAAAGLGIQNVAELADTTAITSEFGAAVPQGVSSTVVATSGAFGPGIYLPGGSGSAILTLDTVKNRYLSYAAMVVPSNDTFVGNASPTQVPLFDAGGNFVAQGFTVHGGDLWDSGTEVNQPFGAAFLAGSNITDHTAENGLVTQINPATQFTPYAGGLKADGYYFTGVPGASDGVVSFAFQVVPEPATLGLLGWGALSLLARRRRA